MKKFNLNTPNIDDIIYQYLNGLLSGKDAIAFKQALLDDPELKKEVALTEAMQITLKEKRRATTKAMLQKVTDDLALEGDEQDLEELEEKLKKDRKFSKSSNAKVVSIIIAVIFGAVALWLFVPYQPSSDALQKVFRDYYQPLQLVESVDSLSPKSSDKGLFAYSKKNYPEVIDFLKGYARFTNEMDIMMALGIAYIEQDDLAAAEKILTKVSKDTTDIYGEDAQWYLALVMLRQGKTEVVRQLLEPLENHDTYGNSAKEILKKLSANRFEKHFK